MGMAFRPCINLYAPCGIMFIGKQRSHRHVLLWRGFMRSEKRIRYICTAIVLTMPLVAVRSATLLRVVVPDAERRNVIQLNAAMRVARMAHTATTLRDGRVLVAGGFTEEAHAALSAETYGPVTERFTLLPALRTLGHSHTATVPRDGRVLLVGGYGAGGRPVSAAEPFDPVTNTLTLTGTLDAARAGDIAVALDDGTVLFAGGVGVEWRFLADAERYDPATGRFASTGSMSVAREGHTAVRLNDGQVLITGGHQGRHAAIALYASAARYDPVQGTFRRVGDMTVRRHKHDAVRLSGGRVLVSKRFNPTTDSFVSGPALVRPRNKHNGSSVLLRDGRVLLAGGAAQAETFDPRRRAFDVVAGADQLMGQFFAVALHGTGGVLITGGYGSARGPQPSVQSFRL